MPHSKIILCYGANNIRTNIYTQNKEEMKKIYLSRECCFVGYSGSKDSSIISDIALGYDCSAAARRS